MKATFTILILLFLILLAAVTKHVTVPSNSVVSCGMSEEKSLTLPSGVQLKKSVNYSKPITLLPNISNQSQKSNKLIGSIAPQDMVLIPGGFTTIGDSNRPNESPSFLIEVKPFFMDVHPVTVAQFRLFVKATGYVTDAEKFGNSAFIDSSSANKWILKEGANWMYPQGKDYPPAKDNHPVTQVSWNDAQAYCKWSGKRLPNEFEFEYAAKSGRDTKDIYPWGNDFVVNGRYKANVWQGTFPYYNEVKDGFKFTSPVGYFGKNALGLCDMVGNVWEWCSNDKFSYNVLLVAASQKTFIEPKANEKAMRGGSFLCEPSWCHGYRVTARAGSSPETALMHVGFRCVKDIN
jgi:sulfatase modifying factor 1